MEMQDYTDINVMEGWLAERNPDKVKTLLDSGFAVKKRFRGDKIYLRGLIEVSNRCRKNCLYCGIRCGNGAVERYELTDEQILEEARFSLVSGYGSVVLQGGERSDSAFVERIARLLHGIKRLGRDAGALPGGGLGITLSLGEQPREVYREWYRAGAHRYLLRIESSVQALYESIHPRDGLHRFDARMAALEDLKAEGYVLGTGVMIGLPGQTLRHLAEDLLFFKKTGARMVGMGPYIPHPDTPMGRYCGRVTAENGAAVAERISAPGKDSGKGYGPGSRAEGTGGGDWQPLESGAGYLPDGERLQLSLKMVALLRHILPASNIAAATALQVLAPDGREQALLSGANVVMPNLTEASVRKNYQLYTGKSGLEDTAQDTKNKLVETLRRFGIRVGWYEWGDPGTPGRD